MTHWNWHSSVTVVGTMRFPKKPEPHWCFPSMSKSHHVRKPYLWILLAKTRLFHRGTNQEREPSALPFLLFIDLSSFSSTWLALVSTTCFNVQSTVKSLYVWRSYFGMAKRTGRHRNQLPHCYYEGYLEKRSFKEKVGLHSTVLQL